MSRDERSNGMDGASAPSSRWGWLSSRHAAAAESPPEHVEEDAAEGLHAIRKSCDVGFAIEASEIEKEAIELARSAASANLPRVDVAYDEVQEEAELAARCASAFRGWVERVRTRVQDALQSSAGQAAVNLKDLEHEIYMLENALSESRENRRDLEGAEAVPAGEPAQLEIQPFLARRWYWLLIPLLVIVDWVANVPVFTELLPKDPGVDAAWREIVSRSESMGFFGGLYRIAARALHNLDASLLALGVIVFLVWLAHTLGESVRRLIAHRPGEAPAAENAIRSHRRQALVPAVVAAVGLVAVLGVLWLGRDRLEATTAARLAETDARIVTVTAERDQAGARGDREELARLEREVSGLQVLRAQRDERFEYARMISAMNLPILLLNLVLAISAAVAGYLATGGRLRGTLTNPRVAAMRRRADELRSEITGRREAIHRIEMATIKEFHRADYLLRSRPLSGWEAQAQRLEAIIPRFRSENARFRGIDSSSITAFRSSPRLELGPVEEPQLTPPAELADHRETFDRLHARWLSQEGRGKDGTDARPRLREASV
jgi:hypothetical protein